MENTKNNELLLNVFITDLEAYNNGELVGEWIDLLSDNGIKKLEQMAEQYGEWFITDYECELLKISEFESIDSLISYAEFVNEMQESGITSNVATELSEYFSDIDELKEAAENILYLDVDWFGFDENAAIGSYVVDEFYFDMVKDNPLSSYIDVERFGRDLLIGGDYVYLGTVDGNHLYTN